MAVTQTTEPGWESSHDGTLYDLYDWRLIGCGNPPHCPACSNDNPGTGHIALLAVDLLIDTETNDEDGRIVSRTIVSKAP